jgi:magnesium transporter
MQAFNVYILVYPTFVLTFHHFPLASVGNVVRRLEQLKSYLVITPHWINYALLDDITDQFSPVLHALEMEIDAIDDLVLIISVQEQADMLRRIAQARKRVTNLQRLLQTKSDVIRVNIKRLESLINPRSDDQQFNSMMRDTCLYLGDIQDHVITMEQLLEHIDTTLSRSHSNYLAQISIDITLTSNRANDTMKKLTALASLMVPLNLLTGLMGMNVRIPGMHITDDDDPNYLWFTGIIVLMALICLVGYLVIRKMQGFDPTPPSSGSNSNLSNVVNSRSSMRTLGRHGAVGGGVEIKRRASKKVL